MSYNEIALQKAGKQHKSELAAKDAEIAALREALENISKHCELMSRGDMYKMTSTWNIANKALEATK